MEERRNFIEVSTRIWALFSLIFLIFTTALGHLKWYVIVLFFIIGSIGLYIFLLKNKNQKHNLLCKVVGCSLILIQALSMLL